MSRVSLLSNLTSSISFASSHRPSTDSLAILEEKDSLDIDNDLPMQADKRRALQLEARGVLSADDSTDRMTLDSKGSLEGGDSERERTPRGTSLDRGSSRSYKSDRSHARTPGPIGMCIH